MTGNPGQRHKGEMRMIDNKIVWRHKEYDPALAKKLVKYFTSKQWRDGKKYPTIEGFRVTHQISPRLFQSWVKEYDELAEAVEIVMDIKKDDLVQKGLSGEYNAQVVKLIAENELNMNSKIMVEHSNAELTDEQKKNMVREYAMEYINNLPEGEVLDID